jgi:hypothetical protein
VEDRTRGFVLGDCIASKVPVLPPETVHGPQMVAYIASKRIAWLQGYPHVHEKGILCPVDSAVIIHVRVKDASLGNMRMLQISKI